MHFPMLAFAFGTLGLISGGGVDVITAPAMWWHAATSGPEIADALACGVTALQDRAALGGTI